MSAVYATTQKNINRSGCPSYLASCTTVSIISNEQMKIRYMKIVKSLEESGLLIKGISESIKK